MTDFSEDLLQYDRRPEPLPQISADDWVEIENLAGSALPSEFKDFCAQVREYYFEGNIPSFHGKGTDGDDWLTVLHREREQCENPIPASLIPFCGVGNGDYHCFRIRDAQRCAYDVVYWYAEEAAAYQIKNLHVLAPDFATWLQGYVHDEY